MSQFRGGKKINKKKSVWKIIFFFFFSEHHDPEKLDWQKAKVKEVMNLIWPELNAGSVIKTDSITGFPFSTFLARFLIAQSTNKSNLLS